jgi:hypothetical protein
MKLTSDNPFKDIAGKIADALAQEAFELPTGIRVVAVDDLDHDVIERAFTQWTEEFDDAQHEEWAENNPDVPRELDPEGTLLKQGTYVRAERLDYDADDHVEGNITGYVEKGDSLYYVIEHTVEIPTGMPSRHARARSQQGVTVPSSLVPKIEVLIEVENLNEQI